MAKPAYAAYTSSPKESGWGKTPSAGRVAKQVTPRDKLLKQIDIQLADVSANKLKPKQKWFTVDGKGEYRAQIRFGAVGLPFNLVSDPKDDLYRTMPKDKFKQFLKDVRAEVATGSWDERIAVAQSKLVRKPAAQ